MKKAPLAHILRSLFFCTFLFFGSGLFSQSLYQDAKALAEMMRRQKEVKGDEGKMWFNLREPYYKDYVFFSTPRGFSRYIRSNGNKPVAVMLRPNTQYLIDEIYPDDTLLIKMRNTPHDSVLLRLHLNLEEIKYGIDVKKIGSFYRITVISPPGFNKTLITVPDSLLAKEKVYTVLQTPPENVPHGRILVFGGAETIEQSRLKDQLPLDREGYYFFEEIWPGDTLKLNSGEKTIFSIYNPSYNEDDPPGTLIYKIGEKEVEIPNISFYCRNTNSLCRLIFGPVQINYKDSTLFDTTFQKSVVGNNLKLLFTHEFDKDLWRMNVRPKNQNENKAWRRNGYVEYDRNEIYSQEYQVLNSYLPGDYYISFFRDSQLIDTVHFEKSLNFNVNDEAKKIDLLINKYPISDKKDISAYRKTVTLDFQKLFFERYTGQMELRRFNHRFNLYLYNTQNNQWQNIERSSSIEIDSKNSGWYQIRFSSPVKGVLTSSLNEYPQFVSIENSETTPIPIEWNPFIDSTLDITVHNGKITLSYVAAVIQEPRTIFLNKKNNLPILLGAHSHLKKTDWQTPNIWSDISDKYRSNPFLGRTLGADLAKNAFEQAPGISDEALKRKIAQTVDTHYPWQKVVFEDARLETEQHVSYEDVVNTYRTPVTTASDNLQAASEQFGSESRKLKRGLSTADLAAGLSDFIVERAQEELNVTFLDRLRNGILHDTAEFSILFPQTRKMLGDFRIVQYRTLLDFAKNAFILDLRNLGVSFPKLFGRLSKYKKINNDPKVYNIFLLYDIANKVYEGMSVDTVLMRVHNRLQERRADLEKSITERVADEVKNDFHIRDSLIGMVSRYDSLLKAFETERLALIIDVYDRWDMLFPETDSLSRQRAQLFRPEWDEQDTNKREYRLIVNNLKGDPDYEYVRERLPFEFHRPFFAKPPDSLKTISAGIDLSRTLLNPDKMEKYFANLKDIEGRLVSMDSLRRELNAEQAKATLRLSNYIPRLERLMDILTQRACLEFALVSELALDKKNKYFKEHDRQSLIYLQQVLRSPEKYGQFDWGPIDSFNVKLIRAGMDTCSSCAPFEDNPYLVTVCRLYNINITLDSMNLSDTLDAFTERVKLVSVMDNIEAIDAEMNKAGAFLTRMASAVKDRFTKIAQDTVKWNALKKRDTVITEYYKQFLFSREMTQGALAFYYDGFTEKINRIIEGDTLKMNRIIEGDTLKINGIIIEADTLQLPEWEIRKSIRLDTVLQDLIIDIYNGWVHDYLPVLTENPTGNAFLDYYDKHLRLFDESLEEKDDQMSLKEVIKETRKSVDSLFTIGKLYRDFLDTLQHKYAGDLIESLRQTEAFATLTEVTLQWLYAFQDGTGEQDSVVLRDTIIENVTTRSGTKEISYDTIRVEEKKLGDRRWITPQKFNEIMEDTLLRKAWLGLLYQRLSAIEGGPRYAAPNMALLATKFMNTIYEIDDRRELLRHKKKYNQPLGFEDYYPFIRSTVDMLNIVLETPVRSGEKTLKERFRSLQDVPAISNEVLSLFEHVFAENYANAIRNVVQLLSITWGLDESGVSAKNENASTAASAKWGKSDRRKNKKMKSAILVYGSFMANMVGAQTPDQVKAAIRSVAVPPGSSSLKRYATFNVSLNGYLGAGLHVERLRDASVPGDKRSGGTLGLSVPIGLAASWGNLGKKSWSLSIFAPVIDLGAVTAYRLDQKNIDTALPELSFGNLIAPGAYFLVNVPRSPFTFGVGMQFGPQTRKITVDGVEKTSGAWRFGVVAAVDVPVFNLFTRQ